MNLAQLFRMGMINKGYMAPVNDTTGDGGDGGSGSQDEAGGEGKGGEEGEGSDKPTDREAELLREVMKKKEKIESLSSQNTELSQKFEELSTRFSGIDPDAVKTLQEELEQRKAEDAKRREQELEGNGDWKTLKTELEEKHQSTINQIIEQKDTKFKGELAALQAELEEARKQAQGQSSVIEELTIGNAFNTSQFVGKQLIPSSAKVRKLYGEHFDVVNGQVQAFDKPRGAEKRHPLIDGDGKPLNFEMALQKIVESDPDKDTILRATQVSGSGSDTNNRTTTAAPTGKGLTRIQSSLNKG
jgi:hypothetical protein